MPKKLPSSSIIWKQIRTPNGDFIVTSDALRTKYVLWRKTSAGYEQMKTSKTPDKLDKEVEPFWQDSSSPKRGRRKSTS